MRTLVLAFALSLGACQTVGIEADPESTHKAAIVATSLAVDAVKVYGTLPDCGHGIGDVCKKPKAYADAKLMTVSFAETLHSPERPSAFIMAGLFYYQYALAKSIGGSPSPTDPEAQPSNAVAQQLLAMQLGDILISTADERVQSAFSVNTSVEDLLKDLDARVSALP